MSRTLAIIALLMVMAVILSGTQRKTEACMCR
jgi:hypothetical protein